jgi:D-glycero-D-manno-heptose 1,7-bisphosphate phosphatase
MLEKAIAKFDIDPAASFMIGDQQRDLEAAAKVGVRGVKIGLPCDGAFFACSSLLEAAEWVVTHNKKTIY